MLAENYILSWSKPEDFVIDPIYRSGTTCKMAAVNNRLLLEIDILTEYIAIAGQRIAAAKLDIKIKTEQQNVACNTFKENRHECRKIVRIWPPTRNNAEASRRRGGLYLAGRT